MCLAALSETRADADPACCFPARTLTAFHLQPRLPLPSCMCSVTTNSSRQRIRQETPSSGGSFIHSLSPALYLSLSHSLSLSLSLTVSLSVSLPLALSISLSLSLSFSLSRSLYLSLSHSLSLSLSITVSLSLSLPLSLSLSLSLSLTLSLSCSLDKAMNIGYEMTIHTRFMKCKPCYRCMNIQCAFCAQL